LGMLKSWLGLSYQTVMQREVMLKVYRYCSLLLTCLYYFFAEADKSILQKITVIFFLTVAAQLVSYLYHKNAHNSPLLKAAVFAETIGITFLLIPTGGLGSPFIWYALNPVLAAGSLIAPYFCWLAIGIYIISTALVSNTFLPQGDSISQAFWQNSGLTLAFVLITLAIQLLSQLVNELEKKSGQLKVQSNDLQELNNRMAEANAKLYKAMGHVMSLYKVVETVNSPHNMDKLTKSLAEYAGILTSSPRSFIWLPGENKLVANTTGRPEEHSQAVEYLTGIWGDCLQGERIKRISYHERAGLAAVIKSSSRPYGLVGIELPDSSAECPEESVQLLIFLSEVSAVVFERLYLNEVADSIVVLEEQNRIANEMHDNVAQRLFSISCGLHVLETKWAQLGAEEARRQLELVGKSMNEAMQELRSVIYQLSSKKTGKKGYFSELIKSYLSDAAQCNNITIEHYLAGSEELLTSVQKNALYRIILESTGNAIRHGKCRNIHVSLVISKNAIRLAVRDDGKGFNVKPADDYGGLGLINMRNLTLSLGGILDINSRIGRGTVVSMVIPLRFGREQLSLKNGGGAIEACGSR